MTQQTLRFRTTPRTSRAADRAPREAARRKENHPELPAGAEERFAGWGVMGVPFASGDVLAMRRFSASSLGEGYTSVWHRGPEGAWTIWADRPPLEACPRYFGSALARAVTADVETQWRGPDQLRVSVPSAKLTWTLWIASSPATRALNLVASATPEKAWRAPAVLAAIARTAGPMLRAGRLGLTGRVPNGQQFALNPLAVWVVARSAATLDGRDFGPQAPLSRPARLGDFWIPQRGLFATGRAFFEAADPSRHKLVATMGTTSS